MAQTIKIKRSATSGNKLTGSNSVTGEFGLNTADKSLYIQTGSTDASVVTVYDDSILHLDDTNNRVGIGTINPGVELEVAGPNPIFRIRENDQTNKFGDILYNSSRVRIRSRSGSNNGTIAFEGNNGTSTTEYARFDSSGHLGIGTSSPNGNGSRRTLHINSDTNGAAIRLTQSSNSALIRYSDTAGLEIGTIASKTLKLETNDVTALTIDTSQNVGIGTTSPARQIHVKDTNYSVARLERDGVGGGVGLEFKNGDGNIWQIGNDGDEVLRFYYAGSNKFQITSSGAARFNSAFTFPTSDGSANQVLKTDGSGNVTWATEAAASASTALQDADGDTKIQVEESADEDKIRFDTAGTERVIIDNTGRVGISTGTPNYLLDIESPSSALLRINNTGSNVLTSLIAQNDLGTAKFSTQSGYSRIYSGSTLTYAANTSTTYFYSSGNAAMTLNGTGLGIGTSAPSKKLDVSGDFQVATSTSSNAAYIRNSGTGAALVVNQQSTGDILRVDDNSVTKFVVKDGGNVGIGTTSPTTKLEVHGTTTLKSQLDFLSPDGTDTISASMLNTDTLSFTGDSGQLFSITDSSSGTIFSVNDISGVPSIEVEDDGTIRLAETFGNVGIGVETPTYKLHTVHTSTPVAKFEGATNAYMDFTDGSVQTRFQNSGGFFLGTQTNHDVALKTNGGVKVMLKADGRLGIGTTSPGYDLDVSGQIHGTAVYVDGYINHTGDSDTYIQYSTDTIILSAGAQETYFKGDGRVGIGTSSPSYNLDIQTTTGTGLNVADDNDWATIRVDGGGGTDNVLELTNYGTTGSGSIIRTTGSGHLRLAAGNTEAIRIDGSNQKVGIGVTLPSEKLHVSGIGKFTGTSESSAVLKLGQRDSSSTTALHTIYSSDSGSSRPLGADALEINTGRYLQVIGASRSSAAGGDVRSWKFTNATNGNETGTSLILYSQADASSSGSTNTVDRVSFSATSNQNSYINTSGNFGLGTSSPSHKLHVVGDIGVNDNNKIKLGGSGDLELYHNATDSYIINNTGHTYLRSDEDNKDVIIQARLGTGNLAAYFIADSSDQSAKLYHGGYQKFGTISNGIRVSSNNFGRIQISDNDNSGLDAFLDKSGINLNITSRFNTGHGGITLRRYNGTTTLTSFAVDEIGDSKFYRDNGSTIGAIFDASTGRFGVGTSAPSDRLHIYENANRVTYKVQNSQHSAKFEAWGTATAIDSDASNGIFLRISGANKVHLDNNGNFGVDKVDPQAKFQVEEYGIETTTTTTSATTETTIDTFAAATFRSARYSIQVTNTTDSTYHMTEILLIHDGTNANITEYGTIFTGTAVEATFDADINSGNVRLRATPATADSMTFKVVRHCITV